MNKQVKISFEPVDITKLLDTEEPVYGVRFSGYLELINNLCNSNIKANINSFKICHDIKSLKDYANKCDNAMKENINGAIPLECISPLFGLAYDISGIKELNSNSIKLAEIELGGMTWHFTIGNTKEEARRSTEIALKLLSKYSKLPN